MMDLDNRDLHTTEIVLSARRSIIEVDPFELMENSLDNLPENIHREAMILWARFQAGLNRLMEAVDFDI